MSFRQTMIPSGWITGTLLFVASALLSAGVPSREEQLAQDRNLGKAFYENPTTQIEAVAEFRKALELAPDSTREKLNYGLALLRAGKAQDGVAMLKEVQRRDPTLPHTWFNLGIYYKKAGDFVNATAQFEQMAKLTPDEPIVHYQLGVLYKLAGRTEQARTQFELTAKLNPGLAAAHFQLYNLDRQAGQSEPAKRELAAFQQLKKQHEGAAIPEDVDWCVYAEIYDPPAAPASLPIGKPSFKDENLNATVDPNTAGMAAIDLTGAGEADLLVWSSRGILLFRHGVERVSGSGLDKLTGIIDIAQGDFDDDGLMDLCILTESGPLLYRNVKGRFEHYETSLPQRRFDRAIWIDYDHDYDLDLILLGEKPALMRNQGSAGFADRTADFPFVAGPVKDAFKLRVAPDSKAFDLAVIYRDRAPVLYRDQLGGRYTTAPFTGKPRDLSTLEADFDNDGRLDRARISTDGGIHLLHNQTQLQSAQDALASSLGSKTRPPRSVVRELQSRWLRVQLTGVKSVKLAQDAEVEIKAGRLYQKKTYAGVPLVFDVGAYQEVDVVRITWPDGLIQNEVKQITNRAYIYKEAERLSGSCPMIWTWNGKNFQFITDVLGVAPLGASDGEGTYFPVAHQEHIRIPGTALTPVAGHYEIHITEELSEVSYLDQVQLFALDHPASTEVFTNDKFKSPPFPDFRLFEVKRRLYPVGARDDHGRDVLPRLLARDQRYPDRFARTVTGVAEVHTLDLNFGPKTAPDGHAVLLLNGWVDWPNGSTFRAAAQEHKGGLIFPYLQARDAAGKWETIDGDMGIPSGKPKTIAVDFKFLSASREVRIVTNLCVYWDEIFLSETVTRPVAELHPAILDSGELHFRGFSASKIDPERKQPETFFYDQVSSTSFWNPTPGFYTRYGDVSELVRKTDDRLVIMGSGDELRLRFRADSLPPLPAGWTRDFLLKVDGWAKDRDANTAFSASVEPLPFHGMSRYPYPVTEHYPDDPVHRRYAQEYNTRPALRLIRPLASCAPCGGN
ncbi:MAG TPA: tetratricopeptide repeat protein [Bryobacteraceae bacterium]|nr:tetratricopeptide repeat protein [Bryobacteraceae bacterium]